MLSKCDYPLGRKCNSFTCNIIYIYMRVYLFDHSTKYVLHTTTSVTIDVDRIGQYQNTFSFTTKLSI